MKIYGATFWDSFAIKDKPHTAQPAADANAKLVLLGLHDAQQGPRVHLDQEVIKYF